MKRDPSRSAILSLRKDTTSCTIWLCGLTCSFLQLPQAKANGLVSFEELGDENNATGLCPTCNKHFRTAAVEAIVARHLVKKAPQIELLALI